MTDSEGNMNDRPLTGRRWVFWLLSVVAASILVPVTITTTMGPFLGKPVIQITAGVDTFIILFAIGLFYPRAFKWAMSIVCLLIAVLYIWHFFK